MEPNRDLRRRTSSGAVDDATRSPMLALSGLDFRPSICARTTLNHRDYASTLLLARCRRQQRARTPTAHPARASRLVQVLSTRLDDAAHAELRRSGCSSSSWAGRWLPVRPEPAAGQPCRLCRCPPASARPAAALLRVAAARVPGGAPPERPPALAGASARAAAAGPQVCLVGPRLEPRPAALALWPRSDAGPVYVCVVVRRVREAPYPLHACMQYALHIKCMHT